jgi:hypothetical protein
MDKITDNIWIGNYLDARNQQEMAKAGIRSILCLDGCMSDIQNLDVGVDRIEVVELIDGSGNPPEKFLRAVRTLRELASKHAPVLVHCHAGQSRSAAVVCKLFMQDGNSLGEAMRRITMKRRVAIIKGLQEAHDFELRNRRANHRADSGSFLSQAASCPFTRLFARAQFVCQLLLAQFRQHRAQFRAGLHAERD